MEDMTTIQISNKTKERLTEFGKMNDTYESIIIKLIDSYIIYTDKKEIFLELCRSNKEEARMLFDSMKNFVETVKTCQRDDIHKMIVEHELYKDKKRIDNEGKL